MKLLINRITYKIENSFYAEGGKLFTVSNNNLKRSYN